METQKSKERSMKYSIIALAVLLAIALLITAIDIFTPATDEPAGMGLTVDPDSGTFVEPEVSSEVSGGGIAIPGWGSIIIPAGETEVAVNLKNPEDNADRYNMTFTVRLDGEDEPIAQTGLIPPGQSALKLKLSKALEPGEYPATVLVQPYRISDNSATNNAEIKLTIIAE